MVKLEALAASVSFRSFKGEPKRSIERFDICNGGFELFDLRRVRQIRWIGGPGVLLSINWKHNFVIEAVTVWALSQVWWINILRLFILVTVTSTAWLLSTSTQKGCKSFGEASTGANMTACLRELKAPYYCSFQVQGVCDLIRSKRHLVIVEKS